MDDRGARARLGIYGGTFAPPHWGHIRAAQAFFSQMQLDELLIMPTAIPPHKSIDPSDDPCVRLEMAHAAFDGLHSHICVSDYEIRRGGASYTWQTLTHFSETTDSELYFLCGTDMFCSLSTWRCPEIIFARATIVCVMRENDPAAYQAVRECADTYRQTFQAHTQLVHTEPLPLSSTEIRARVRAGECVNDAVPAKVAALISRYGLYQS